MCAVGIIKPWMGGLPETDAHNTSNIKKKKKVRRYGFGFAARCCTAVGRVSSPTLVCMNEGGYGWTSMCVYGRGGSNAGSGNKNIGERGTCNQLTGGEE